MSNTQQNSRLWLPVALAVIALAVAYAVPITALVGHWSNNPLYSFGFAVPLISGYLIWTRLPDLKAVGEGHDYLGGSVLVLLGGAMLIVGSLGSLITVQQASFVVVLAGLVLALFGRPVFARVWFPIAYLAISIPIFGALFDMLQHPSQRLSAQLATTFLRGIGVPALRDGTHIVLPNVTLEVLRECSGVNQLVTFTAMSLPAAYLFLTGTIRRTALVLSGIAISYLTNGVRITLVGWLAYRGLGDGNIASLHLLEGLAVSVLGYAVFGACLSLLSRKSRTVHRAPADNTLPAPVVSDRREWLDLGLAAFILVLALGRSLIAPADVVLTAPLSALPTQIADWRVIESAGTMAGVPEISDALVSSYPTESGVRRFQGIDDELVRTYRGPNGEQLRLYVGYLRSQRQGKELAGQASSDLSRVSTVVAVDTQSGSVEVSSVEKAGIDARGLVYWYDLNGRIARDTLRAKRLTLWDALTRRRTNGAVILVEWTCPSTSACPTQRESALGFVGALVPVLRAQLPS